MEANEQKLNVKKRKACLDVNHEKPAGKIEKKQKSDQAKRSKKPVKLLLAYNWDHTKHDPTHWWMSEKLDGLRAYWDGQHFYSRLGHRFPAPEFVLKQMPPHVCLDGELFSSRGQFQTITSIVRSSSSNEKWNTLKFHCFDVPSSPLPFEDRLKIIQTFDTAKYPFLIVHPHSVCEGKTHVLDHLKRLENEGAEGLMLRAPKSLYEPKRSKTLLKVKSFARDEFKIVGYVDGKGKFKGKLGGYLCRTKDGKQFGVGSGLTDVQRELNERLPLGTLITVQFQELSEDKIPRFPTFVGVAIDK